MACVEWRIANGAVLKLIRQWLRAPILEEPADRHQPPRKVKRRVGTPQGGVISPLLANLYLHWMEKRFHGPQGPAQRTGARLVRYADDFVILDRISRAGHRRLDRSYRGRLDGPEDQPRENPDHQAVQAGSEPELPGLSLPVRAGPIRTCQAVSQPGSQPQGMRARTRAAAGDDQREARFGPNSQADRDGQPLGPRMGQLLRPRTQPPHIPRHELVSPTADGTAPETSEPAPLPATERGDLVCTCTGDWAWCNSNSWTPLRQLGCEDNRKAQCGKTACCV